MPGLIIIVQNNPALFERNRALVREMAALISHEPFYESRFLESHELGLCAAQVYLDHEPAAGAPGKSSDGSIQCLLSGEIVDLKTLKAGCDCPDASQNCSQIMANLYAKERGNVISRLNGYFSLLVFDEHKKTVLVANDRFGMQRFYFARLPDGGMMFAPEVKCFRLMPELELTVDTAAVVHSFRHDCILNNASFYNEVRRFPVATVFRCRSGRWTSSRYWTPHPSPDEVRLSQREFIDQTAEVFEAITEEYYTPGSTALSFTGGLDTRAILSVLSHRGHTPPLFTFGGVFKDSHDIKIARKLAGRGDNRWGIIRLGKEFLDDFPSWAARAAWISDGIARLNTCHEYYLNLAAREFGKIRLTGKYGSQVIRGVTMLKDRSPDLRIFSDDFRRTYIATKTESGATGRAALLEQELPQLEGARHTLEMTALTVRTPYMDNRLIDIVLRAPDIEDTSLLQKHIISRNAPHLSDIPTNRGELIRSQSAFSPTRYYYRTLNFIDSVYNWEKLPRLALPVCRLGDITRISRLFVGRNEWIHHRVWFMRELKDFVQGLILDPRTLDRPYYDRRALTTMMRDHFSGRANYTPEIIKIGSFELWCRGSEQPLPRSS
ncbi:MAG: hypothetical protein JSW34_10265 [Candidatus Zixiibacteriota bacterium]|nr:MAG: hypothetical protein JSW34_10265 [candidate division Zixibacteria bacterium]